MVGSLPSLSGFQAQLIIALLLFVAPSAFAGESAEYPVLTHADYEAATGCDVARGLYERGLRIALTFLVFEGEPVSRDRGFEGSASDAYYVRRHSRDALAPMFASAAAEGPCLHPTVAKIGGAVGIPESGVQPDPAPRVREPAGENVAPYLLTSRPEYMQRTGCLVSPSTYNHFRVAFFEHVLSRDDRYDAAARMRTFLRETGEGKQTADGFLDSSCMTPTIRRIANELKLIGARGEFLLNDDREQIIAGDFNGDGYLDNAYASATGDDDWHLVVQLDVLGDDVEIVVLDEHSPSVPIDEIKLEVMPPSEYVTFCGRAPSECEPDAPHKVTVTTDSIYLIVLEASASIIYWDSKTESYLRHWLSD
jgi:hypothetical protein